MFCYPLINTLQSMVFTGANFLKIYQFGLIWLLAISLALLQVAGCSNANYGAMEKVGIHKAEELFGAPNNSLSKRPPVKRVAFFPAKRAITGDGTSPIV